MKRDPWRWGPLVALLVAISAIGYYKILSYPFIVYDTALYVPENPMVRNGFSWEGIVWAFDPSHGYAGNWHPLTWLSHMLDCQLLGLDHPGAHLAVNLLLHIVTTIVLFFALWRLTERDASENPTPAFKKNALPAATMGVLHTPWPMVQSAIVAALFAVHPQHVESVAWLAERKDVLCALFWMLGLWFYARYVERATPTSLAWVLVMLVLGLLSKPMMVTFPCVLLLLDAWPLARAALDLRTPQERRAWQRLAIEKLPMFAIVVVVCWLAFASQQKENAVNASQGILGRLNNGVWSYGMYVLKTFWPFDLACFYPHHTAAQLASGLHRMQYFFGLSLLVGATLACVWLRRSAPYLLVGWLWFVGTLVPCNGTLIHVGDQAMADRFTYIPHVGLFIALVWGAANLVRSRPQLSRACAAAAVAVIVVLTGITWHQVDVWRNSEILFRHAVQVTDDNAYAYAVLGDIYRREHRLDEALEVGRRSVEIDPGHWIGQSFMAATLLELNRFAEARWHAQEATKLAPGEVEPRIALGLALYRMGNYADAAKEFEIVLRGDKYHALIELPYAESLIQTNRAAEAEKFYERVAQNDLTRRPAEVAYVRLLASAQQGDAALTQTLNSLNQQSSAEQLLPEVGGLCLSRQTPPVAAKLLASMTKMAPRIPTLQAQLATALTLDNRIDEASDAWRAALKLAPQEASFRLALAQLLLTQDKSLDAVEEVTTVLSKEQDNVDAIRLMGDIELAQERHAEAEARYRRALELVPNQPDVMNNLAWLLAQKRTPPASQEAVHLAERMCQLVHPPQPEHLDTLALAYASAGRWQDAAAQLEKAIALAREQQKDALVAEMTTRLKEYRQQLTGAE